VLTLKWDQRFESAFLHRRVCKLPAGPPDLRNYSVIARRQRSVAAEG